jgi:hypothetical protein
MTRAQRHRYAGYVKGLAHQRPGGGLVVIVLLGRQLHATDMPLRRAGVEDRSPAKAPAAVKADRLGRRGL